MTNAAELETELTLLLAEAKSTGRSNLACGLINAIELFRTEKPRLENQRQFKLHQARLAQQKLNEEIALASTDLAFLTYGDMAQEALPATSLLTHERKRLDA